MKKIICFILTAALLLSSTSVAFAKSDNSKSQNKNSNKQTVQQVKKNDTKSKNNYEVKKDDTQEVENTQLKAQTSVQKFDAAKTTKQTGKNQNIKVKKQEFKINGSPVIKYGRYLLPIKPVTQGMGAAVTFDSAKAVLTVTKGTTTIVINFLEKTVTVNGVADTKSGIFTSSNSKKRIVLIKYIANALGIRVDAKDDEVTVEVPGLDLPTNVTVTTVGTTVVPNTLNTTTLYLNATANIKAGQATGGKAELYVGTKLVATDSEILATDTTVTFTMYNGTNTNAELQAAVPAGGIVTVKLYNAGGQSVISNKNNPTLIVDYAAPTISSVSSAALSVSGGAIYINADGAGALGDTVDVTKISLTDTVLGTTYQLTNTPGTGSTGIVSAPNSLIITLGSADKLGIVGFGSTSVLINLAVGSLLSDAAGNTSVSSTAVQTLPVTVTN